MQQNVGGGMTGEWENGRVKERRRGEEGRIDDRRGETKLRGGRVRVKLNEGDASAGDW